MEGDDTTRGARRLPAAERAEQLLDVAEALFVAKGFDRTSIGDIAAAAGVSRPVVYEHHGSKEGVYLASMERAKRRITARYTEALAGVREPREVLRAAAGVYFAMVDEAPDRWVLLYGGSAVPLTGEFGARLEEVQASNLGLYVETIGQWVRPDVGPDQLGQVVHMIFGAAAALSRWWLVNRDFPRGEIVDSYTTFCWHALAPLLPDTSR